MLPLTPLLLQVPSAGKSTSNEAMEQEVTKELLFDDLIVREMRPYV